MAEYKTINDILKLFKDKASKYVEINRKRKNDPNFWLPLTTEPDDTFEGNPIDFSIRKQDFYFVIDIWSYDKNNIDTDDDSVLFSNGLSYHPTEDFSSSVTTKELIEIMCYDIEDTIKNKRGKTVTKLC